MTNLVFIKANDRCYSKEADRIVQLYREINPTQALPQLGYRYSRLRLPLIGRVKDSSWFNDETTYAFTSDNILLYFLWYGMVSSITHKSWCRFSLACVSDYDNGIWFGITNILDTLTDLQSRGIIEVGECYEDEDTMYFRLKAATFVNCHLDKDGYFNGMKKDEKIVPIERKSLTLAQQRDRLAIVVGKFIKDEMLELA